MPLTQAAITRPGGQIMASKSKFPIEPTQPEQRLQDGAAFAEASRRSSVRHRVSRIAQALRIPEAVLYDKTNAVMTSLGTSVTKDCLDVECATLLQAYKRIDDPAIRYSLLTLVQQVKR